MRGRIICFIEGRVQYTSKYKVHGTMARERDRGGQVKGLVLEWMSTVPNLEERRRAKMEG